MTTLTFCGRCSHPMHWHECGVGETTTAGRCKCRNDVEVVTTGSEQATTREALLEIANASDIPDGWEPYDNWGDYNNRTDGQGGEISVDSSNSGDIHSHGFAMGQWSAAKVARAALRLAHRWEDAAVADREAELRAEIAAMKGDLFRKGRGSEVWVQRAAVLAILTSSERP